LNRYQSNILSARAAAYVGTVGLVAALVSSFLNTSDPTQSSLRQILSVGGLILAGGSFAFSFAVLRTNESNLKDAVQYYNSANPNTPIQLQFSTSVLF
jgi:protein-S-isoprenylcysteine O-methyltransferase Ste14